MPPFSLNRPLCVKKFWPDLVGVVITMHEVMGEQEDQIKRPLHYDNKTRNMCLKSQLQNRTNNLSAWIMILCSWESYSDAWAMLYVTCDTHCYLKLLILGRIHVILQCLMSDSCQRDHSAQHSTHTHEPYGHDYFKNDTGHVNKPAAKEKLYPFFINGRFLWCIHVLKYPKNIFMKHIFLLLDIQPTKVWRSS